MNRDLINMFIAAVGIYTDATTSVRATSVPLDSAMTKLAELRDTFLGYPEISDVQVMSWLPALVAQLHDTSVLAAAQRGEVMFTIPAATPGLDVTLSAQQSGDLSFPME